MKIRPLVACLFVVMTLPAPGAFAGARQAILRSAGVSWDDVVDITSFHTDLTTQMPAIVAVKNLYIKRRPRPGQPYKSRA